MAQITIARAVARAGLRRYNVTEADWRAASKKRDAKDGVSWLTGSRRWSPSRLGNRIKWQPLQSQGASSVRRTGILTAFL